MLLSLNNLGNESYEYKSDSYKECNLEEHFALTTRRFLKCSIYIMFFRAYIYLCLFLLREDMYCLDANSINKNILYYILVVIQIVWLGIVWLSSQVGVIKYRLLLNP